MFKQLLLISAVLVVLATAGKPFQEDRSGAIRDLQAAGVEKKVAEAVFEIESKANHAVAAANGDSKKIKEIMDSYNEKRQELYKKLPKDQVEKLNKFFD